MTIPTLVLVTSSFPIAADGSEAAGSFVADLAQELAKHVHVRVVAPGPQSTREQWSERVEIYRFAAPSHPLSTLRLWHPGDLQCIAQVLRAGQQATDQAVTGAQHIVALWGLPCGEWARRAASRQGIAYSVWMLGSDVWSLGRIPLLRGALRRVIQQARHAYADGYQLAADAQKIGRTPVAFLPSTRRIDLRDPPPSREQPPYRLLFLGRWHPNKGVDLLLDALGLLGDEDWQRIERVEIQGGGSLEPLVRERVAELQEQGRPVEAGRFLTKPEAEAAIARADWILIPSRIESIPVVFSDAMKLGRPVLATPVGDLPQLLRDGPTGMLADGIEADAFAAAIERLLVAPDLAHLKPGIAEMRMRFSLEQIATRLATRVLKEAR
ncbi:MAG: glycosyltransferase family 4 protein [Stenotrophomonas nitritireducens]|uniref:glycosyltransferase family 4 protein n=1 Tax=Stenotrophomonas nitritireducens TaxID=83617 RepID=UPI001AC03F18|nr:glycosyltransferase family 4 protein [Stenotrophomonas nitritireducens]MBN8792563.1 glycosyltransferase family 4 protein [Stenotrophomonas nitritireducens]MBN8796963.1 glycosyltransferase family 4 protein [Stenotrophomonas nitritireducens]